MFTTVHKSIRFVGPSTSQEDTCIPLCFFDLLCDMAFHGMVSTNRENNIDFYDEIFEIPWKVESPDGQSVCYGLIWLAVTMTSDSWSLAADFWSKEKDQHSDGSKLLVAYTLTKKCTWNAPKIPFKCQFKKCMYQKIACVRISLIHLSHFYVWGRPFVFLLLAVCHFKK